MASLITNEWQLLLPLSLTTLVEGLQKKTSSVLLEKLAELGIKAYNSVSDVDNKLEKLRRTFWKVQSLIQDAEDKRASSMVWQVLIQAVERAAYDADDLLDEIFIRISEFEGGHHKQTDLVRKLLSSLFKTASAPNLNDIQANLDDILSEISSLSLMELVQGSHLDKRVSKLPTSSLPDNSHPVFGRDADKDIILNMLVSSEDSSRSNNVGVIPIVGMIGVGKTTLAQLVYNHDYQATMRAPFNLKMWVSVAQDFNLVTVTRAILEAANSENASHLLNLESLQIKLVELLQGKKFLLVLDDLWNEKRNEWDLLLKPLQYGLQGSKIIVTTGSHVVCSLVGTTEPYLLNSLSVQDCWSLLKEEAFRGLDVKIISRFEEIGMKIAKKCKGLPSAAKTIGTILKSKVDENEWNNFVKCNLWELTEVRNEIAPAVRSGYHRLPPHLRQCFAYCSMFPQTYSFEKDKVVQMWMGEGFIMPGKERKMIEEIGNNYFDHLLWTSFFHKEGEKCRIHDAVHYLAQSVSAQKFYRVTEIDDIEDLNLSRDMRHLSLVCEDIREIIIEISHRCRGLRSFILLREYGSPMKEIPFVLFTELRRLRVLDLSSTLIDELTGGIGNLRHLRFLDLSNTHLKWLPETCKELCALQTLRLVNCTRFLHLPKCISRLKRLRHLELGCSKLTSMPPEIGKLTGLLSISEFVVGPEIGQMKELKNLNEIRGSLCIRQLENVKIPQEAADAALANKKYLDKLELQWSSVADARNHDHVLEKIMVTPHESLKELCLKRYGGRMFPTWVSSPLFSRLASIHLSECENCGLLPSLGKLPKLKSLKIEGMHELIVVDDIFMGGVSGFQSLETLIFYDMPKFERWTGIHEGDMACLRELTIVECDQLVILPSLHYLKKLEKLEFEMCPKLPSLPEENLSSSIKSLVIKESSLLENRCEEDVGQDWRKIKHIPYIEMDYKIVRDLEGIR